MELNDTVTVVVGRGLGEPRQFSCRAALLSMHSPFFDNMFQNGLRETNEKTIELPEIPPSAWEEFVKIIQPREPGNNYELRLENVSELMPLFDYFRMPTWLHACEGMCIKYLESNTSGEKRLRNEDIGEFWRKDTDNVEQRLEERSTIFDNIVTIYKSAVWLDLNDLKPLATIKLVDLLRWIEHTADLFDGNRIQELVPQIDFAKNEYSGLEEGFMQIIGDKITHNMEGGCHPRHVFDFMSTILRQEALERRVGQLEPQVVAAKKLMSHVYKDYPYDLFGRLPHDNPNSIVGSLEESKARQTLQEMMSDSYNNFRQELELLGIDAPLVDDLSSIEIQTRDAVYHYIKANDEHGTVPVSIEDIYTYIIPIFTNCSKSDRELGEIFGNAVKSLLDDLRIATYNGQRDQYVSAWSRRQYTRD